MVLQNIPNVHLKIKTTYVYNYFNIEGVTTHFTIFKFSMNIGNSLEKS